jgi:hypothetical protein
MHKEMHKAFDQMICDCTDQVNCVHMDVSPFNILPVSCLCPACLAYRAMILVILGYESRPCWF